MKNFLLILFFAKTVALTSAPIDIRGKVEILLDEPIEAITSGASIQIDVSSMVSKRDSEDILQFRNRVNQLFPAGTIEAILFNNNETVNLIYKGNLQFNDQTVLLVLNNENGIPTNKKFHRIILNSQVTLSNVTPYWKNYKQ